MLNILRSHPDTTWPQGEFHEVFRWRGLRREGLGAVVAKTLRYAPVRLGAGDILDPDRKAPREGLLTGRRGRAVAAGLAAATAANRAAVLGYKAALREHGLLDGAPGADADAGQGDELQPPLRPGPSRALSRTRSSSA